MLYQPFCTYTCYQLVIHIAQAAASQTTAMMNDPAFREALGDTIAGVSIDAVFQSTAEHLAQGPYII